MPCRQQFNSLRLRLLPTAFVTLPFTIQQKAEPGLRGTLNGKAEPCLTSGGKAEAGHSSNSLNVVKYVITLFSLLKSSQLTWRTIDCQLPI